MDHMASQMDSQIDGAISENEALRRENEQLRSALESLLIAPAPLTDAQIDKINCDLWASCPLDLPQGRMFARAVLAAARKPQAPSAAQPIAVGTIRGRYHDDGTPASNTIEWEGRCAEDDFTEGTILYTIAAPPIAEGEYPSNIAPERSQADELQRGLMALARADTVTQEHRVLIGRAIARLGEAALAPQPAADDAQTQDDQPWPEWASEILQTVREFSGRDGFDDHDGIDLPGEVRECLEELAKEAERTATIGPAAFRAGWLGDVTLTEFVCARLSQAPSVEGPT